MSTARDYKKIQHITADFKTRLEQIPEELFQQSPPTGGWSYSEVYFHIFDASILTLRQLSDAANGKGEKKPTVFVVKLILFFGSLPPGKKFKAPRMLAERLKTISKQEALALIDRFSAQLTNDYKSLEHADPSMKTIHPRMGYFNAFQWLRFIMIHLKHHLHQLQRIDRSFQR